MFISLGEIEKEALFCLCEKAIHPASAIGPILFFDWDPFQPTRSGHTRKWCLVAPSSSLNNLNPNLNQNHSNPN